MSRGDDILKEACAQIAMEETDALEKNISPKMNQAAKALYMRNRRKIFALIAKNSKKQQNRFAPYFRAAACLAAIVGTVWMLLHPRPQDLTPTTQLPTATIMPYYTMEPSPSPSSVPTEMPIIPTKTPEITENANYFATIVPEITEQYELLPTLTPTLTQEPTQTPTPAPTMTPAPTPEPLRQFRPDGWSGIYFPGEMPENYTLLESTEESGKRTAVYTDGQDGNISFTEYDGTEMIPIPENAQADYMQLHGGVALRMTEDDTVTLVWQMEERTLVLTADAARIEEIANSVKKISEE